MMADNRNDRWLLVTDVDETLLGCDRGLARFVELAGNTPGFEYVLNSSRPLESVLATLNELPLDIAPTGLITALGTEITLGGTLDLQWQARFGDWDRTRIDDALLSLGAEPHAKEFQTRFKASFAIPPAQHESAREAIRSTGLDCLIIASGKSDFDVLPPGAGKAPALFHVLEHFHLSRENLVVAGDSGNDIDMFDVAARGIVVGNAREELKSVVDSERAYLAREPYASGILEGLRHWNVALVEP